MDPVCPEPMSVKAILDCGAIPCQPVYPANHTGGLSVCVTTVTSIGNVTNTCTLPVPLPLLFSPCRICSS